MNAPVYKYLRDQKYTKIAIRFDRQRRDRLIDPLFLQMGIESYLIQKQQACRIFERGAKLIER
jgi:hypothetical protein